MSDRFTQKTVSLKPVISVVIPSYRSEKDILACLDSVMHQTITASYEVTVVDSSPTPIGPTIWQSFPGIRVIQLARQTLPGRARSIGAEKARGRIVAFTDTDCVVDPDWLERLWDAIRSGYSAAGGSILNGTPQNYVGTAEYLHEFNEMNPAMPAREVDALPSCNLAVENNVFKEIGGFPDFMKGEDTIFCDRIRTSGHQILFVPEARITHFNRTRFWGYLKNQISLGEGAVETRRRTQRHGYFLVHWPPLLVFIPVYRTLAIALRFWKSDKRLFGLYLLHYPLISLGLLFYTWGFIRGPHRSGLSTEKRN